VHLGGATADSVHEEVDGPLFSRGGRPFRSAAAVRQRALSLEGECASAECPALFGTRSALSVPQIYTHSRDGTGRRFPHTGRLSTCIGREMKTQVMRTKDVRTIHV